MIEGRRDNQSQITAAQFNPTEWLGRLTEAGGSYVAGVDKAHLLSRTGNCELLDRLSQKIADHDRREAVSLSLRAITDKVD
jgi:hypothetical protein